MVQDCFTVTGNISDIEMNRHYAIWLPHEAIRTMTMNVIPKKINVNYKGQTCNPVAYIRRQYNHLRNRVILSERNHPAHRRIDTNIT